MLGALKESSYLRVMLEPHSGFSDLLVLNLIRDQTFQDLLDLSEKYVILKS